MNARTHGELAGFIWRICNLLRGPYKRNEYRKVILPLTVLRRFDCVLAETKDAVLAENETYGGEASTPLLQAASGFRLYNVSELDFKRLLDDPNLIASNLSAYINGFSANVRQIFERFGFEVQIAKMDEKNLLFQVVQGVRAGRPVARACRQHADGLRVRGIDPDWCGAGERGGGGALHAA